MLTVLLAADDPKSLAEALEVLVPSAIDGLVRQVVVSVGPEPVLTILAEDAGAEIVSGEGSLGRRLAPARRGAFQQGRARPFRRGSAGWVQRAPARSARAAHGL